MGAGAGRRDRRRVGPAHDRRPPRPERAPRPVRRRRRRRSPPRGWSRGSCDDALQRPSLPRGTTCAPVASASRVRRPCAGTRRRRAAVRRAAAAAAAASDVPARAGSSRPWSLVAWLVIALPSPWARRLTDQVDAVRPAPVSPSCAPTGSPTSPAAIDRVATGWTLSVVAIALLVAHGRVPALAPPVHVPRQRRRARDRRRAADRRLPRPRPYDVTIIGAGTASRCRRRRSASCRSPSVGIVVHAGRARPAPHDRQGVGVVCSSVVAVRASVPRRRPPLRRPRRRRASVWRSRSTPSGSSPRTRSFPVTYRAGKTAHLDVGGRRGEAHPARRRGPARRHRGRRQAGRPRRLRRLDAAAAARRRATPTRTCSGSSTR